MQANYLRKKVELCWCQQLISMHNYFKAVICGLVAKSCRTLVTPGTVACQAPLSMGFSRQEYWSELPFPSLGDLFDPGLLHCRKILYWLRCKGSPCIAIEKSPKQVYFYYFYIIPHFNRQKYWVINILKALPTQILLSRNLENRK